VLRNLPDKDRDDLARLLDQSQREIERMAKHFAEEMGSAGSEHPSRDSYLGKFRTSRAKSATPAQRRCCLNSGVQRREDERRWSMTSPLPHLRVNPSAEQYERTCDNGLDSTAAQLLQARNKCHRQVGGWANSRSLLPHIGITKRTLKKLEAIQLVREQRDQNRQELAYNARPFVLCGLPLRRPPLGQAAHTRRNGRFFLEIRAHPRFGLPYGQDRLIPIWVATLALKQKTRVVRFYSGAQILDFFHLPKDGLHYRRIVQGFQRIFAATIFFGNDDQPNGVRVIDWSRFHLFDRMQFWFNQVQCPKVEERESYGNIITLSEGFYREIGQDVFHNRSGFGEALGLAGAKLSPRKDAPERS
jgi:hypothetical protein